MSNVNFPFALVVVKFDPSVTTTPSRTWAPLVTVPLTFLASARAVEAMRAAMAMKILFIYILI